VHLNSVNANKFTYNLSNGQNKQNSPCFTGKNSTLLKIMINDVRGIKNTLKEEVAENVMEMMPSGILSAKNQVNRYAGEVADGLSMANVSAKYNSLRLALSALGVICGSQIKTMSRIRQDVLIDPLHLERASEFLAKGLKLHPDTILKGDVVGIVEKLKPKEDLAGTFTKHAEKFVKGYENVMNRLIEPNSVDLQKKAEPVLTLTEKALLKFEKFAARVDKAAAHSIIHGTTPQTQEGKYITTQIYDSLISGGPGLNLKTFNPWRIFPLDSKEPINLIKGKPSIPMPESFVNEMKAKGLTEEVGLKAIWNRYVAEHPTRVLRKVEELKEISDSSISLVTSKMRKASVPQELIQL